MGVLYLRVGVIFLINIAVNNQDNVIHTPESLANIISNGLQSSMDRKVFQIEGVYISINVRVDGAGQAAC